MASRQPETLSRALESFVQSGKSPCAFGIAMSRVPARRWDTRADLYECLAKAKSALDRDFREPIKLAELSRLVGVSPFHFQRHFGEFYGMSPSAYRRSLRLREARALIAQGSSVVEACLDVGFQSVSTFTRYFRREFGESPSGVKQPRD